MRRAKAVSTRQQAAVAKETISFNRRRARRSDQRCRLGRS